jgi:RND superfamily putative drug exporter
MGHFEKILRFNSPGYTEAVLPAVLFAVLFGLAMDYEVFLLARIKESFDETGDNDRAVQIGVERTTGIITGAAMAMVIVAGGFALADLLPVKIIGVGIALAVFLDATLVRGLMVPAVMKLMGRWNWYLPGFLNRLLPQWKSH